MGTQELLLKFTNNSGNIAHGMKIRFELPIEIMRVNDITPEDKRYQFQIYFFDEEHTTLLVKKFNLVPETREFTLRVKSKNRNKVIKASWRVGQYEDQYDDADDDNKEYYRFFDIDKWPPDEF